MALGQHVGCTSLYQQQLSTPPAAPAAVDAVPQANQGGAPSRREAMFGLLGAGLGVGFTTAFFKGAQAVVMPFEILSAACVMEVQPNPILWHVSSAATQARSSCLYLVV